MNRFPPTLGVVGFDFGFKPAFSVAVLPRPGTAQQVPEDDPPIKTCFDLWGAVLPCVTAGIASCGQYFDFGSGRCFIASIVSGVNGAFNVTWTGVDWENTNVGRVSVQEVDCDTGDPIGDPAEADVVAIVSCDPASGELVENMGYEDPIVGGPVAVFQNSGAFIDTPASNGVVCGTIKPFGGGTFTAMTP